MSFKPLLTLGLLVLLGGCGHADKHEAVADVMLSPAMAPPPPLREKSVNFMPPVIKADEHVDLTEVSDQEELQNKPATAISIAVLRLLVYHATMRVKVASLPAASTRLDSLVRQSGGYTSASTEAREDGEWQQETTIRVRPNRFGTLLTNLANLGSVERKSLTTDDVTAEHADVAARLRTKRAVEQRYLALLSQAKKVSDMLEIEEKVGAVREEIESTESRLKTLNDEVNYSTITLTCYQVLPRDTPDAPIISLGSRMVGAVYDGWGLLTGLFIGAVSLWPLLIVGGVGIWAIRRWRRRRAATTR